MENTEKLEDIGYLQDIISYIFDEKRILTYKWISNTLGVHVNRAKQLLYTFIKHISEERLKQLKVTYLIGGILSDNKGCRIQVVSEEDLENVKKHFKVITSEHIYSASLKNCLSDIHDLVSVDGVKACEIKRNGAIRCNRGVAREAEEAAAKRQGAYVSVDDGKQWPAAQPKQPGKQSISSGGKASKAAGGISAMFSKQASKGKKDESVDSKKDSGMQKEEKSSSPEKKQPAPKNGSKGGNASAGRLAAMFSAQSAKPKPVKKDVEEQEKTKDEKKASKEERQDLQNKTKPEDKCDTGRKSQKMEENVAKSKGSKSESKAKQKSKPKKRKTSDKTEDANKRRKRIVVVEDSDSSNDDIFGSEEEDGENAPLVHLSDEEVEEKQETPDVQQSDAESAANGHHGRKRRLVDKTFEDEDGYIVTKKVYEFVSCSESEGEAEKENEKAAETKSNEKSSEPVVKAAKGKGKAQKSSPQKKNSPPEKKKQATLMSFFKRS